jgi:RimJ/RimL family protein N-acetyltransferase
MSYIITTERLHLRAFTLDDTDFIITLLNSEGWLKFIGDRQVHNTKDAYAYLANGPIKSYNTYGFGLWMVMLKENNLAIGMCGLLKRDTLEHPDIGFAFLPEFMGNGYAYEAAKATIHYAKQQLLLATVLAITLPTNERSINLLEKSGLKFIQNIPAPDNNDEILFLFSTT